MVTASDLGKRREIMFQTFPSGQIEEATRLLSGLPGLEVSRAGAQTLEVAYRLGDYCLEDIESALEAQGFHLFSTLLIRIKRALVYYCERVQLENMNTPEPLTKNFQAHVEAWNQQPHGDHDDTPVEWRQYK